ncbi:MAG: NHL repeat-containing protein [Cystobacterineae bacterium]|nr:NHL repeat-containing protein [Cystobacterineae bacterium]
MDALLRRRDIFSLRRFHFSFPPRFLALVLLSGCFVAWDETIYADEAVSVSTFAGGTRGHADELGAAARFYYPEGLAMDAAGNLYVADNGNERIRKISPEGEVSTLAGTGASGLVSGPGNVAQFSSPKGLALDAAGNLYVADSNNHRIRKISPEGAVSNFAGGGITGPLGGGFVNGQGAEARFYYPEGLAIDAAGNLYVADTDNHRIRKISPQGVVSTFAGGGLSGSIGGGFANGQGTEARFRYPQGLAIDAEGNLYVADSGNHRIRKISPEGEVASFAGNGMPGYADGPGHTAHFHSPRGLVLDTAGNLYVADSWHNRIRKISPGREVSTLAGERISGGYANGPGHRALFSSPRGMAINAEGNLYVADSNNHRIRKIVFEK